MFDREDKEVPLWISLLEAELKYKATRHRIFHEVKWGLIYGVCFAWICGLIYGAMLLVNWIRG